MEAKRKIQTIGFLSSIAELDLHIEFNRKLLNQLPNFDGYFAFIRLTMGMRDEVTPAMISRFVALCGGTISDSSLKILVRMFDSRFCGALDYEDFLKLIISLDCPDVNLRACDSMTESVDIATQNPLRCLSLEVEQYLLRFFKRACQFIDIIRDDCETKTAVSDLNLFQTIDADNNGGIDYNNLQKYFASADCKIEDSKVISILRRIDINNDGKITQNEFNFFIDIFSGIEPEAHITKTLRASYVAPVHMMDTFSENVDYSHLEHPIKSREELVQSRQFSHNIQNIFEEDSTPISTKKYNIPLPGSTQRIHNPSRPLTPLKSREESKYNIQRSRSPLPNTLSSTSPYQPRSRFNRSKTSRSPIQTLPHNPGRVLPLPPSANKENGLIRNNFESIRRTHRLY